MGKALGVEKLIDLECAFGGLVVTFLELVAVVFGAGDAILLYGFAVGVHQMAVVVAVTALDDGGQAGIEEGAVVCDSIIMNGTRVGKGTKVNKSIVAEKVVIGSDCELGIGEEAENREHPNIYCNGLVTLGEGTVIPNGIHIGKNTVISGRTTADDYNNGWLGAGESLIKAGEDE